MLEGVVGLKPGDRVIVILPRIPEWWLLNLACLRSGKISFVTGPHNSEQPSSCPTVYQPIDFTGVYHREVL